MADNMSSWDIMLQASLDTSNVPKEINEIANKYKNARSKAIEIQARINLADDGSDTRALQKRLQKYTQMMNDYQKQISSFISKNPSKYMNDTNYDRYKNAIKKETQELTDFNKRQEQERQKIIQQSEAEQARIVQQNVKQKLQANKEYYNQLAKIRKQLNSEGISQEDKDALVSQQASLRGSVGSNTGYINTHGTAAQQAENKTLAQTYQTNRLIEQSQENQKKKAQEIKNAYNDLLTVIRQINSNNKEISQLESKNHLNSQEKERLTTLKQQTDELQDQYNAKMKIVSQDSNLQKKAQQYTNELEQQNKEINKQNSGLQTTGKHSQSLLESVKNIGRYVLMYQALNAIQTGVQKAYETITELDKAFTDIQLVTGDTDEEINQLSQDYNDLAKQMGATTQEVAEGASEWFNESRDHVKVLELLETP